MQIQGTIKLIGETQVIGNNGFQKRELVITTDEQYPQTILIEFIQDKVNLLEKYAEGEKALVSINIRGREWINPQGEVKYFNSIHGWRIEGLASQNKKEPVKSETKNKSQSDINDNDDLPF